MKFTGFLNVGKYLPNYTAL